MGKKYDFSGWATRANLKCSDGRVITPDAFKHHDGKTVPLVYGHQHHDLNQIVGNATLQHRAEGMYAFCSFNSTESGKTAKLLVEHGDVTGLSICANQLKEQGPFVQHGMIREVSLVLASANPGAYIENVMMHGEELDDEAIIYNDQPIEMYHSEDIENTESSLSHEDKSDKGGTEMSENSGKEKTIQEIFDEMSEEQKEVVYAIAGQIAEEAGLVDDDDENEGGNENMKHNLFDGQNEVVEGGVLTHADQMAIMDLAKQTSVGDLKTAMAIYAEKHSELEHSFDKIGELFPDHKDVKPGAPELLTNDLGWVDVVMKKAHKSPISRIRTRQADSRIASLRAKGYNDREVAKALSGDIKLLSRTTDPQTVYRRDELHRDDIIDITDFSVVDYNWKVMQNNLKEEIAIAAMIGDGREDIDPDKIKEEHIRPIWKDEELYTIHADVDIAAARNELNGSNTGANFGENYIYAEAVITAALYAREQYKGKGPLDLYCTPHLLNVMLLARDLNGRRIYASKADLAAALNVENIYTAEQFAGQIRTTKEGAQKKLLGIFVNMANYQFGHTKGGEITKFEDFNIDFNKYQYLLETRLSGALTEVYSAIALEEPVTEAAG